MTNPFAEFEKTASDLGFSQEHIEQIKKEALANFHPDAKEKQAAEETYTNYVEGFVKTAAEYGVGFDEAVNILKSVQNVKTAEELNAAVVSYLNEGKQKVASENTQEVSANFVKGYFKVAAAYGIDVNTTAETLVKQGFDMEQLKALIQANPEIAGGLGGAGLGAGVGALAGGGKGALTGGLIGGGLGAGAGYGYRAGGDIIEDQQNRTLGNAAKSLEAGPSNTNIGKYKEVYDRAGQQGNFEALARHLLGKGLPEKQ